MTKIHTFVLLLISILTFGQVKKEPKTLNVIGYAMMKVRPDIGILIITSSSVNINFSKSISSLNDKTKDITQQLKKIGFEESEIKTTNFKVEENRVERNNNWIDSGYVATQNIKVEFQNNSNKITEILKTFSQSQSDFKLAFDFTLSDSLRKQVQNKIIELAVNNTKEKCNLIAKSSGVKILKLKEINYGNNYYAGMQEVNVERDAQASAIAFDSNVVGFTPNDLIFQESISMIWEID